jgi:DNA polymerase elongation subunit (family B)
MSYFRIAVFKQDMILNFLHRLYKRDLKHAYAHNFSSFDSYFILRVMIILNYRIVKIYMRNNSIFFIEVEFQRRRFFFRDTFLLFPKKLAEITYSLAEYRKRYMLVNYITRKLIKYAIFDVISLFYLLCCASGFLRKIYRIEILSCITSTQFMYKLFLLTINQKLILTLKHVKQYYVQDSYAGGFVDITNYYGKNIYYYDINSLYPYVMLKSLP